MAAWTDKTELVDEALARVGSVNNEQLQVTENQKTAAARDALREFNDWKPRVRIHEESGSDTTLRYALAGSITGWDDDVSDVRRVWTVAELGTDDETKTELEWSVERDTNDAAVLFLASVAGADNTLRVEWSTGHTVDGLDGANTTTVAGAEADVLSLLVSAKLADMIRRNASDLANQSLGMEQADFESHAQRWLVNAKRLRDDADFAVREMLARRRRSLA